MHRRGFGFVTLVLAGLGVCPSAHAESRLIEAERLGFRMQIDVDDACLCVPDLHGDDPRCAELSCKPDQLARFDAKLESEHAQLALLGRFPVGAAMADVSVIATASAYDPDMNFDLQAAALMSGHVGGADAKSIHGVTDPSAVYDVGEFERTHYVRFIEESDEGDEALAVRYYVFANHQSARVMVEGPAGELDGLVALANELASAAMPGTVEFADDPPGEDENRGEREASAPGEEGDVSMMGMSGVLVAIALALGAGTVVTFVLIRSRLR